MIEELRKQLRDAMNEIADDIATGGAADWPMYQRMVGRLEGYAYVERLVLDIAAKLDLD